MRWKTLAGAVFGSLLVTVPAWAATVGNDRDPRCITLSDVVILAGEEAVANKRLCKSPGSARYDVVEVTAAVYGAATTKAAFEKSSNADLRAQREKIEVLRLQKPEGRKGAEADQLALVRAQQHFIATLAANDLGYAETIEQFRSSVADIAGTSEGLAALARYNAGDEAGALTILDKLRAANDAARRKQSDLASAVEGRRIAGLARDARLKGKVSTATVIARYEEVTRLDPGVFDDWLELADDYYESYRLPDALRAAENARKVVRSESDSAAALAFLGKILLQQGNVAGSAKANGESLAIRRKIAIADPANSKAQRAYAISIGRVGEVQRMQGDAVQADKSFDESLNLFRRLAAADPGNAQAQRDLFIAIDDVGLRREEQSNLIGAINIYQEGLNIVRKLAETDPHNLEFQNDISVNQSRIGGILFQQSDLTAAENAFKESIAVARMVGNTDSTASNLYGLATSLNQMANLRIVQKDFPDAGSLFVEVLSIDRKLAAADPSNVGAQAAVSSALIALGDLRVAQNDLSGAESAFDEGLSVLRKLALPGQDGDNQNGSLSAALDRVGFVHFKLGRLAEAGQAYDEALAIFRKEAAEPSNFAYKLSNLAACLSRIGEVRLAQNDVGGAESAFKESLAIGRRLIAEHPKIAKFHQQVVYSLGKLADIPGSGTRWRDVVVQWEAMAANGMLAPSDRQYLKAARKKAATEKR